VRGHPREEEDGDENESRGDGTENRSNEDACADDQQQQLTRRPRTST
jgi:hypothetical protein